MLTSKEIYDQVSRLTGELIATGLCDDQNFPSMSHRPGGVDEIGVSGVEIQYF